MTDTTDIETLRREAAEAQARAQAAEDELAALEEAKRRRREAADSSWRKSLLRQHIDLDEQLVAEEATHRAALDEALSNFDLESAIRAWAAARGTRTARRHIRNEATNAAVQEKYEGRVLPDEMRHIPVDLLESIESVIDKQATILGNVRAEELLGQPDYGEDAD